MLLLLEVSIYLTGAVNKFIMMILVVALKVVYVFVFFRQIGIKLWDVATRVLYERRKNSAYNFKKIEAPRRLLHLVFKVARIPRLQEFRGC